MIQNQRARLVIVVSVTQRGRRAGGRFTFILSVSAPIRRDFSFSRTQMHYAITGEDLDLFPYIRTILPSCGICLPTANAEMNFETLSPRTCAT